MRSRFLSMRRLGASNRKCRRATLFRPNVIKWEIMAGTWFPSTEGQRLVWMQNFLAKIGGYQATLGLAAGDITAITNDLTAYTYMINLAGMFKTKAQDVTAYKNLMADGNGPSGAYPTNSVLPAAPTVVQFGVVARLSALVNRIVAAPNYTLAIGEDLGIVAPAPPDDPADPKPTASAQSLANSQVQVTWTKGAFTGVIVESQRASEVTWTLLAQDYFSPYIDTRAPLVAAQPEVRRYRLRYLQGDTPTGSYSDIIVVTTTP